VEQPPAVVAVLLVDTLGVAAVVLGEADDYPGSQGQGVLLVVAPVGAGVPTLRRAR